MPNERGPVGGAGELTAAVSEVRDRLWEEARRGPEYGYLGNLGDTLNAALDAKAPHHRWPRIRHAAKAPQGVAATDYRCQHCAVADQLQCVLDNGHQGDCMFAEWPYRPSSEGGGLAANPGYPAPESTGGPQKMAALPVPGPVSDTTIHHGMFPPAASGAAPSVSPNRKFVYRFLELPHHKKIAIGQELKLIEEGDPEKDAEMFEKWFARARERGQLSRMQELVMGEAAAPKPAPNDTSYTRFCPNCSEFRNVKECNICHTRTVSIEGAVREREERPTPAPGAERPHAAAIAREICNHRGPETVAAQVERATKLIEEALAAAPPAPTWVCGNGDHACNLRGYCVNPNCDRHASAERVREEIANELSSPYKESIFTPLSDDELMRCVDVLTNSGVRAASDRLHASWARHWSKVLRSRALPPSTREKS